MQAVKANEDRAVVGIGLMLIAYFMFSMIDTSVKWLAIAGLPALQLAFMRYATHFLISLFIISKDGFSRNNYVSEKQGLVVLRGSLLMLSTVLNFFALRYLPLTLTSTILFSAPLIVCALSMPLLGERVGIWRWMAIMIGFCGILIAIRPFGEGFHWAVFLSMASTFCFAMYSILTRKLAGVVSTNIMQFYSGLMGFCVLLPFAVANWVNPDNLIGWVLLCALGVWGWGGHQLMTNAHRYAPASILSPFSYSFIIYLTVWSYFLFDHLPDRWTITGASIIVFAGLVIWFREKSAKQVARPPSL